MSTRSAIGYRLPSGKIKAAYCHRDGYPSHQLPILNEHYDTLFKVQALIRPGSMSSLRTEQLWNSSYDTETGTYTPSRDPQPLYHQERGDGDPPSTSISLNAAKKYWAEIWCEHLYVYDSEHGWQHHELTSNP